jgi:hypothetical protein
MICILDLRGNSTRRTSVNMSADVREILEPPLDVTDEREQ